MLAKKKTKVVVVESELAKFGKMLVNFVRARRDPASGSFLSLSRSLSLARARARALTADRARARTACRRAQLIHFPWKYVIAFAVGAIVTIAVTLGVRTSSDARPYLYNGGKLGSLEKESVFVGDKKKN